MVTHELTVYPDGRIDGAFSVREGDYNSHTLRFVLTQDLAAASAKLLLWPAAAEKPTVYDTKAGQGTCAGQDIQFTPAKWGSAESRTQIQLELLNSAGDVVWQSMRISIPVLPGFPDDTVPGPMDTSDATAQPEDVAYGQTYYAKGEKKTGSRLRDPKHPRGWTLLPVEYIKIESYYYQRVSDTRFVLVVPTGVSLANLHAMSFLARVACASEFYDPSSGIIAVASAAAGQVGSTQLSGNGTPTNLHVNLTWTENGAQKTFRVELVTKVETDTVSAANEYVSCLETSELKFGSVTKTGPTAVEARNGEVFYYYKFTDLVTPLADTDIEVKTEATYVEYGGVLHLRNGTTITITLKNVSAGFAKLKMVDLYSDYSKTIFIFWPCDPTAAGAAAYPVSFWGRTDPAVSFLKGAADLYDYAGNGLTCDLSSADNATQTENAYYINVYQYSFGPFLPPVVPADAGAAWYPSGTVQPGTPLKTALDTLFTEGTMTPVYNAYDEITAITENGQTLALANGALGEKSYWLMRIDGELIHAPKILDYLYTYSNICLELIYTCADGFDVGYPYAGE
jgi:hypothetical protein